MPFIAAAVGPVAALIGGSGFGALLTNALIGTAINFAVGAAIDWFTPDEPANQNNAGAGVELQFRAGAKVPVSALMGIRDTPGHLAYHNSYGTDNEFLQLLFIDGNGEHDAMFAYLVDNAATGLTGSNDDPRGFVIEKFRVNADGAEDAGGTPHAWVKYHRGAEGQGADPELVAHANPAERWTNQCTMTATAYRVVTLKFNPKVFGGAIPQMRAVWRGLRQYDRRKDSTQPGGSGSHRWGQRSTYEWTENPAICQDNWRLGVWVNGVRLLGLGVSPFDCHHAGIVAAANVSDEQVTFVDTGRTLPRYTIGVEIKDGSDPISMMRLFETSMGGFGAEYGGAYTPLPAQTMLPVLTLSDRDRVAGEDVSEQTRMSPTETKTAFHGQYLNPDIGWMPDDYDIRFNAVAETTEGGRRMESFDATFVRHPEAASMLAEIKVRRDRFSAIEVATYGPQADSLKPGQVITRVGDVLGTRMMMVLAVQRQPQKRYRLSLRSWDNTIVPLASGGFMDLPVQALPSPVPVRLTQPLAFLVVAVQQESPAASVPAIRASWAPILDGTVNRVIVKYWPAADPTQVRYAVSEEPASGILVIDGVSPETEFRAIATIATSPTRPTTWTNELTVVTGRLSVAIDGNFDELAQEIEDRVSALNNWATYNTRETIEEKRKAILLNVEGAVGDYNDRQIIRREASSTYLTSKAQWSEDILVATGPGSSIVVRIEDLRAEVFDEETGLPATSAAVNLLSTEVHHPVTGLEAVGDAILSLTSTVDNYSAGGRLRIQTFATSSGAVATAALGVSASSSDAMGNAAIYLNALSDGSSEAFVVANRFAVKSSPTGTLYGIFAVDAGVVWIDEARIRNLKASNIDVVQFLASSAFVNNFKATWAQIQNAVVENFKATNANIENLSIGRDQIAEGAFADYYTGRSGSGNLYYSDQFIAGSKPITLSAYGRVTVTNAGSANDSFTQMLIEDLTSGATEYFGTGKLGGSNNVPMEFTSVRALTDGHTYRIRYEAVTAGTNSASITLAPVFSIVVPRK